jgi:hypothetical protein
MNKPFESKKRKERKIFEIYNKKFNFNLLFLKFFSFFFRLIDTSTDY